MASTENFKDFILEQASSLQEVSTRKMFGEYCLYVKGKMVGVIADDRLFIKPTEQVKSVLKTCNPLPAYDGAKLSYYIEEVDNREYVCQLLQAAYESLPEPKQKKKAKK